MPLADKHMRLVSSLRIWRQEMIHRISRLMCLLALCGFANLSNGQTLRWATQGDLLILDPHAQNENLTNSMNGQVYEFLVRRDKNMRLEPALATEWTQVTPTLWRMKLRSGVKFHDGSPFTADDVAFSVFRARDDISPFKSFAVGLGEPKVVDATTVEFVLPQYNPIFLEHASRIFIMSKTWSEKNGVARPLDFKNKESKFTTLNANGTGPYMLASRQPDVRTTYRRNPQYWGKFDGNVQEVVYTPIKNDATRAAALMSGEVDFLLDPGPQDVLRLRTGATKVIEGSEIRVLFIGMDQAREELLYSNVKGKNPFKDPRVRKALYHAVDIEAIRLRLMRGMSLPTGAINPSPLGNYNDPEIEKRLPFDLPKARDLMAQAGYPQGFEVALDCSNNRYINDEEICIALSAMWSQIGVKVKVNAMPSALFFTKGDKLDTSMYMLGWGGSITDAETTITPILRARGPGGTGTFNWGGVKNPKIEELGDASSKESDPIKREQLIKAVMREHNEQVHHIPLHRQVIPWAMRTNVDVVHRSDNWLEWRWISIK
jgi:peptide/nickel transport system substrate-binding protein